MGIFLQACTGQNPAELKNSTTPRQAIKSSCSTVIFEGQVFSSKNILNIFDCSGWSKQYPALNQAIKNADKKSFDSVFEVFNKSFLSDRSKRQIFFQVVANAENNGGMDALGSLLEKALSEKKILTQLNKTFEEGSLRLPGPSILLRSLSESNPDNVKSLHAIGAILGAFEKNKYKIHDLLGDQGKKKLSLMISKVLTDASLNMDNQDWNYVSRIIHQNESPLREWALEAGQRNLENLLEVIKRPELIQDIKFIKNSLVKGLACENRANTSAFKIHVEHELKFTIESLKNDEKEVFENKLLDGLLKYIAFQNFCEKNEGQQQIKPFYNVLKVAEQVVSSEHDFLFLKKMHQVFDQDRFVLLSLFSSEAFSVLQKFLVGMSDEGHDEEFIRTLNQMMAELSLEDFQAIAELMNRLNLEDGAKNTWLKSWSSLWKSLSDEERLEFIKLVGLLFDERVDGSKVLQLMGSVFEQFPELSRELAHRFDQDSFQQELASMLKIFSEEAVQDELAHFLSRKGLFDLIKMMTYDKAHSLNKPRPTSKVADAPVQFVQPLDQTQHIYSRNCFLKLTEIYEKNPSYYSLANTLPESCLNVLGQVGFVGQIYLWMNSSNSYFQDHLQIGDFHSATGVWSPGMLQFIFSAAVQADVFLTSNNGNRGIRENLSALHGSLTRKSFLESFHLFSDFYTSFGPDISLDQRISDFINSKNDKELNLLSGNLFALFKTAPSYLVLKKSTLNCQDLSPNLGVNPCFDNRRMSESLLDLVRVLKRKNETGHSLMQELLKWIHPDGGIELPSHKIKSRKHQTSMDEIIRFLYDLSSEKTNRSFVFRKEGLSQLVQGHIIERLEVVIRDIGFLNNFYGAYFKNQVAGATDYRQEILESEKLLFMLDKSGGPLRSTGIFPKETKQKLKNIRSTYSSLAELSDDFIQADGTTRTYGPFIQSLLALIETSSKQSTQNFSAYRKPDESIVEGHNGIFLTKVVQMSGLRHLSSFVRSRFDGQLSGLNSDDFKKVNKNLFGRHSLPTLQARFQSVLDKYLDHDRNQLNLIIHDTVVYLSSINEEEQTDLEEIAAKLLVLLSDEKVSDENIEKVMAFVELAIEFWPELKKSLEKIDDRKSVLDFLNHVTDQVVTHPGELNGVLSNLLSDRFFDKKVLRHIFANEKLLQKLVSFINQSAKSDDFDSQINWNETLTKIFSQRSMKWEALRTWFKVGADHPENKLTLSLLISYLGEKSQEGYRLQRVLDELFINHQGQLDSFLKETFKSLELKPD